MESELIKLIPYLKSYSLRLTGDMVRSDDLVQETLLKSLRMKHSFDGRNLKAWSKTIMRNLFINQYRKRKVWGDNKQLNASHAIDTFDINTKLVLEKVNIIIRNLPEKQRNCITLYSIGYTYEEIAEKIKIPIGTVKSNIFISRNKIQKKLLEAD